MDSPRMILKYGNQRIRTVIDTIEAMLRFWRPEDRPNNCAVGSGSTLTDSNSRSAPFCAGHTAPFDLFSHQVLERPSLSLWHGPRGSGKSFLSALDTHLCSWFNPRHETRILGGSLAQSEQIHRALGEVVLNTAPMYGGESRRLERLQKTEAVYENGSRVAILAASPTSVRGPHVPSLKLDEVDEIPEDIRDSALGMAMEIRGQSVIGADDLDVASPGRTNVQR